MAGPATAVAAKPVATMSLEDKLFEFVRRSEKHMPVELWAQIRQLLTPEAIAVMAVVTTAWAVSHFFGVGEIADAVLLVVGSIALGASALQAGKEAVEFALTAKNATTDADLDRAAEHFGKAVVMGGVAVVMALFFRAKPKVMNDMRFGRPVRMPSGPGPSTGGLFYQPTVRVGSIPQRPGFFTSGTTNLWGDIAIESSIGPAKQAEVLLHEQVHALLTPKFYFLRNVRIRLSTEGYNRSYLLRYLEEALAQSNALVRTKGLPGLIQGMRFPVKNGYVTIAKMGQEAAGILLGPINASGVMYRVYFNVTRPPG